MGTASNGHRHEVERSVGPLPYFDSVAREPNRAAHGGVRWRERCRCGAERHVLQNGRHVEEGPWRREVAR